MASASVLDLLSPRERDCLRLLQTGLGTPQAAASLGISVSTLNKHLASARSKLGVSRTIEALLLMPLHEASPRLDAKGSAVLDELQNAFETCNTFDETWDVLHAYAAHYGVTHMTCGICAEPPGQLTNGARAIAMSHPDPMPQMYRDMGGERMDPTVPYTVMQTRAVLVDNQHLIRSFGNDLPKPVGEFGQALLDNRMRFSFHKPERDNLTRAPMVCAFFIDPRVVGDIRHRGSPVRDILQSMSRRFWDTVQDKRMLRSVPGLTARQIEALAFAARGFSVAEMAEQMGVSLRSGEKTLAAARGKLGARTTTAAVYRAMVYRVFG
ncbi:MAG: helix-turn-helix transcriptional regulator [Alphaproteobacteria bacterium]|nr:helix-turn-helix transcriptional regulator [Alphaproteobacteria bacterium]